MCRDIMIKGSLIIIKCDGLLSIHIGRSGFQFTRKPPLFSELNGYAKAIKIGFGWRMKFWRRGRWL